MGTLLQDLRFTFRQLRKSPSFAVTAILTLALGIGVNTAIFSLVNAILIKPLPVADPAQIVSLVFRENSGPVQQGLSWNEYKEVRAQSGRSFSTIFAYTTSLDGLAVQGQRPDRVLTSYVSGNFFDALGLKPAAGRLILPGEGEIVNHDPIVVLGYDYWMRKFSGDRNIIGRPVTINGHPMTIVGVAPKGFKGMQGYVIDMAAYIPLAELPVSGTPESALNNWRTRMFQLFARLRPGATVQQGAAELGLAAQSLMRLQPDFEQKLAFDAYPEPQLRINPGDPKMMLILAGLFLSLAAMVLLLACVNVANLVLVRATVREREMAIRTALGARRSRLVGQMITESVTLAIVGGVLGVLLGYWATGLLGHLDLHADLPVSMTFDFDWRIFLYSFAIALAGGIVVGALPALRMAKSNVNTVLHEGSRGVTTGRHWLRDSLVVLQIAGSLVLLVVAALFVRSLTAMQTMDLGFRPDHVMNFVIDANEIGMTDAEARNLASNIRSRLHQIAGVDSVSHASYIPLGYFGNNGDRLIIDGAPAPETPDRMSASYNIVSPDYFSVMGIDLLSGRAITEADNEHGMDVAVISQSAAKKFWPGQDPIGRGFRMTSEKDRKLTVIGVARDAEFQIFGGAKTQPFFYVPYTQHSAGNTLMAFQIRSSRDLASFVPTVEKTIHDLAPELPIFQVQTMRQALYTMNGLLLFQIGATLAGIMGLLGLTLAVIGLYGVVSYTVGRRVHEIGLRMALGASRAIIFKMIYRHSVLIVAIGIGIGLAVSLLAAKAVGSLVVVSVWDPVTYASVGVILAIAALASSYLPARRAMSIEPMVALRED